MGVFGMINIITKNDGKPCIKDFEAFFERYILASNFTNLELGIIQSIDKAKLLNDRSIETRYGVTSILSLSTGCKIVLSYIQLVQGYVDLNNRVLSLAECGTNALNILFDCVDLFKDSSTVFLLTHTTGVARISSHQFCINGNICNNLGRGLAFYGR